MSRERELTNAALEAELRWRERRHPGTPGTERLRQELAARIADQLANGATSSGMSVTFRGRVALLRLSSGKEVSCRVLRQYYRRDGLRTVQFRWPTGVKGTMHVKPDGTCELLLP